MLKSGTLWRLRRGGASLSFTWNGAARLKVKAESDKEDVSPVVLIRPDGIALGVGRLKIRVEEVIEEILHLDVERTPEVKACEDSCGELRRAFAEPLIKFGFALPVVIWEVLFLIVKRQTKLSTKIEKVAGAQVAHLNAQGQTEHIDAPLEEIFLAYTVFGDKTDITHVPTQKNTTVLGKIPVEVAAKIEDRRPAQDGAHLASVHFGSG